MYIRILKRHGKYVAEFITSVMMDQYLQALAMDLRHSGVKKRDIIGQETEKDAFSFNDFEKGILRDFIPD